MRRDILERIRDEFIKGEYVREFKVGGHSYTLRLLSAEDEVWRDKHVPVGMNVAVLTARKLATLAVSLVAIDGERVETIFGDEKKSSSDVDEKAIMNEILGSADRKYEIAELVYRFLGELPGAVIDVLYGKYVEMENERNEGLKSFLA